MESVLICFKTLFKGHCIHIQLSDIAVAVHTERTCFPLFEGLHFEVAV